MGILRVSLIVISFLATAAASAKIDVKTFGMRKAVPTVFSHQLNRLSTSKCTDFSGVYTGKCSTEDADRKLEIFQSNCESIRIDGDTSRIGAIQTSTRSEVNYAESSSQHVEWDEGGDKLSSSYLGHLRLGEQIIPLTLYSQMSLVNDQLRIKGMFGEEKITCSFSK